MQGNVEDLLLPPLEPAQQLLAVDTTEASSYNGGALVFPDRNRTWTGVSSTLTGLAASEWSLGGSSSTSGRRATEPNDRELLPMPEQDEHDSDADSCSISHSPARTRMNSCFEETACEGECMHLARAVSTCIAASSLQLQMEMKSGSVPVPSRAPNALPPFLQVFVIR